jgi:hypothetical protein
MRLRRILTYRRNFMHSKPDYLSNDATWDPVLQLWIEPPKKTVRENYDTETVGSDAGTIWPWKQQISWPGPGV